MHKIFAKTLFLGKSVVFLPHCHSTNEVARALDKSGRLKEGTVVLADFQEKGKGQQGNVWVSEAGKNLLFTLLLKPKNIAPSQQFYLNALISTSLHVHLATLLPTAKVEIKWPNDLYVNDRKIVGILIETTISGARLESVFCGVGLNVNQTHFTVPTATSLHIESGLFFDRDQLLEGLLAKIEVYYPFDAKKCDLMMDYYESHLRWKDEKRTFQIDGEPKEGIIRGVNESGKLMVKLSEGMRVFGLKEITFLY